jgi:hypothetical protein
LKATDLVKTQRTTIADLRQSIKQLEDANESMAQKVGNQAELQLENDKLAQHYATACGLAAEQKKEIERLNALLRLPVQVVVDMQGSCVRQQFRVDDEISYGAIFSITRIK